MQVQIGMVTAMARAEPGALVKSEKFQMNHECAIAGSGFSAPTTGFSARYFDLR
jgi:hypothetical protein